MSGKKQRGNEVQHKYVPQFNIETNYVERCAHCRTSCKTHFVRRLYVGNDAILAKKFMDNLLDSNADEFCDE